MGGAVLKRNAGTFRDGGDGHDDDGLFTAMTVLH
jgi:hypothetical protein